MSVIHHHAAKSKLTVDLDHEKLGFGENTSDQPLCPKPRRLGPAMPEFLKTLECCKHNQERVTNGRNKIITATSDKIFDAREYIYSGSSPSSYPGSPPGRTSNPLVHDAQFAHQMELYTPYSRTKLSEKFHY